MRLRLVLLCAFALCAGLVATGCGGGSHKAAGAAVCGEAGSVPASYEPSGDIVADNGFRPDTDGFGVENYGNCGQTNLTPGAMSGLFGAQQVCLSGRGADCQLDPAAEKWMEVTNEQMAGGHCMGFSVTALRFYSGNLSSSDYGADSTFDLDVANNRQLESAIAAGWVYQFLPRVTDQELTGPPNAILQAIVDGLRKDGSNRSEAYSNGGPLYTIKIFNADGGHAITPYAVEDKGDGKFAVLVYDNNYPGITRAVEFDTNANTWSYNAATRPDLPEAPSYPGDAGHPYKMRLDATLRARRPRSRSTSRTPRTPAPGIAGSAGSATLDNQISLLGNPSNHAHLLIRDSQGRVTGLVKGKMVNQIPGVQVQQIASIDNWCSTASRITSSPTT